MACTSVYGGEPVNEFLRARNATRAARSLKPELSGRAIFLAATIALHLIVLIAFMRLRMRTAAKDLPAPLVASLIEAPAQRQIERSSGFDRADAAACAGAHPIGFEPRASCPLRRYDLRQWLTSF